MNHVLSIGYRLALCAILLFIALPILVVVVASVSPTSAVSLQPWEWTFAWYGKLWVARWIEPFYLSVKVAAVVAILSGVLGFLAAYAVVYEQMSRPRPHHAVPAVAAVGAADRQGRGDRAVPVVGGALPVARLARADRRPCRPDPAVHDAHGGDVDVQLRSTTSIARRAAWAPSKWQRVRYVLFPLVKPGLFSGMTLAFIISFNDVPLSLFLVRPGADDAADHGHQLLRIQPRSDPGGGERGVADLHPRGDLPV